jgi:hypothetical protein
MKDENTKSTDKQSAVGVETEVSQPWARYRFKTKSVDDYRPLIFNPKYPWWCTGFTGEGEAAIIVAYLPHSENIYNYWNDAFDMDWTSEKEISFSDRFPQPDYYEAG